MLRHHIQRLIMAFLLFSASTAAQAQTMTHTPAKQAIIVDYDTGMVLFEKNADEQMPTSSMSKVITIYHVFEALKSSQIQLSTDFPVSEKAWKKGGSKMFVEVGKRVKVEDLIRGVVIQSGNDATIVLAEGLAGTEESFADALNVTAKELGMTNSHFMNASGWPDPGHYSTARDLSTLATALIHNFPEYYHYFAEQEFTFNNIKQPNRNPLLYRNIGADGIKTGHTDAGGYGLMASGKRDGRRVIMVVNGLPDDKARASEGSRLLDWGLRAFENVALFEEGETVESAEVAMGKVTEVPLVLDKAVKVSVPKSVKNDLRVEAVYNGPLVAPIKKGDQVGTLKVDIPTLTTMELPLYAGADVGGLGLFAKTIAKAKVFISGNGDS